MIYMIYTCGVNCPTQLVLLTCHGECSEQRAYCSVGEDDLVGTSGA